LQGGEQAFPVGERPPFSLACGMPTQNCQDAGVTETLSCQEEEDEMGRILASLVVAAALMSVASSEASAWVCRSTGFGSGGWARSASIIDAKFLALRRCERHSPVPVCTLLYCRPGG